MFTAISAGEASFAMMIKSVIASASNCLKEPQIKSCCCLPVQYLRWWWLCAPLLWIFCCIMTYVSAMMFLVRSPLCASTNLEWAYCRYWIDYPLNGGMVKSVCSKGSVKNEFVYFFQLTSIEWRVMENCCLVFVWFLNSVLKQDNANPYTLASFKCVYSLNCSPCPKSSTGKFAKDHMIGVRREKNKCYRNFHFRVYKPNNRSSYVIIDLPFLHNKSTIRCKQNQVGQHFQERGLIYLPEGMLGLQLISGSHMKNAKTNNKTHHTLQFRSKIKLAAAAICFLNGLSAHWSSCKDFLFSHQFYRTKSFLHNNVSISWFIWYDDLAGLVFVAKPFFNFEKTAEANLPSKISELTPCALRQTWTLQVIPYLLKKHEVFSCPSFYPKYFFLSCFIVLEFLKKKNITLYLQTAVKTGARSFIGKWIKANMVYARVHSSLSGIS